MDERSQLQSSVISDSPLLVFFFLCLNNLASHLQLGSIKEILSSIGDFFQKWSQQFSHTTLIPLLEIAIGNSQVGEVDVGWTEFNLFLKT